MRAFGWTILALVFLTEVLSAVAAGFIGGHYLGPVGAIGSPVLVLAVWWLFASPRAPMGTPVRRVVVKCLVILGCGVGLILIGHVVLGVAFVVFSAVVNALAGLPQVRALLAEQTRARRVGNP